MATARKLPSGNYRVRVYDKATNKYKSFTAPTKKEAERLGADWLSRRIEISEENKTLGELATDYINMRSNVLSPASIDKYVRTLDSQFSKNFKSIKMGRLTVDMVADEVNRMAGRYSPKSVKCAYSFIAGIIKKSRPDLKLSEITLPKVFQKKKIYPNVNEIIELFRGDRMELEVLLALFYGLRKEEIRGLKKSDVNGNVLTINRVKIDVKGNTITKENSAKTIDSLRQITLHRFVIGMINDRSGEFVTEMSGQAIYKHFKRKIKTLGYDITFHDLRHINASVMLLLGVPDKYAMERGGWSTDSTLKKVYQSTFTAERKHFDSIVDDYFLDMYDTKYDTDF